MGCVVCAGRKLGTTHFLSRCCHSKDAVHVFHTPSSAPEAFCFVLIVLHNLTTKSRLLTCLLSSGAATGLCGCLFKSLVFHIEIVERERERERSSGFVWSSRIKWKFEAARVTDFK